MMTKEADARLNLCQKHIQASRFANVTYTPTMPLETYACWRIMSKHDVHAACDRVSAARPPLDAPYPPLCPNARWACCEVTLTIRPQPRAAICGPNRCPSRNGAVRLTAMVRSQSATASAPSGGRRLIPAQLTRMSGGPNAPAASSAARSTCARSASSALIQAACPPASRSPAAASSSRCSSRATSTTCAPAPASAVAIPAPMPELPPVTTATRPASEKRPSRKLTQRPLQHRPGADEVERVRGQPAAAGQRLARRLLVQPGGQEAGDERVAGPGAVDDPVDRRRGHPYRRPAVGVEQRALGAELDGDVRVPGGQHPGRLLRVIPPGEHDGLGGVDE